MEDIRIGRKVISIARFHTITAAADLTIKANPNRVGLIIGVPSTNPIVIGPDSSVSLTRGIGLFNTAGPFNFTIQEDGDWITRDIWTIGFVAQTVLIIESFLYER